MKLTPAAARDAAPGATLRDHEVKGLQLRCGATAKSWQFYYTTRGGEERRPTIGRYPDMTLSRARDVARGLKDRVAAGEDPSGQWQAQKAAPTMADLCAAFERDHVRLKNGPTWAREVVRHLARIRKRIGSIRVAEVDTPAIDRYLLDVLHRKHSDRPGPPAAHMANQTRRVLSKMFTFAERRGWRPQHSNPVRFAERFNAGKRKTVAAPDELPRLFDALRRIETLYPPDHELGVRRRRQVACILTLFLTGARVNEIQGATVDELRDTHLIKTKHKTARHIGDKAIRLPRPAVELLRRLPPCPSGRLFGDITLRKLWNVVRLEAGCPDLQLRDIRRTFASYALSRGVSLDAIGNLYGHTDTQTTHANYAFLLADEGQAIVEDVAAHIAETAGALPAPRPALALRLLRRRPLRRLDRVRGSGSGTVADGAQGV